MTDRPPTLRDLLETRRGTIIPGCHDALGVRLIEQAGFAAAALSGFAVSATLGLPDGAPALDEMVRRTGEIAAASHLPLLVDGDDGHGDADAVAGTVRRFAAAGASGLHIDDQRLPRPAGTAKSLVPIADVQAKVAAAVAARGSSAIAIVGRTDAVATDGLDAALHRARAIEEAGADAVMIMYLTERDQVARAVRMLHKPLVLAVTETARKGFRVAELADAGHAAIVYPVSTLLASLAAQHALLAHLGRVGDTEDFIDRMMPMAEVRPLAGPRRAAPNLEKETKA